MEGGNYRMEQKEIVVTKNSQNRAPRAIQLLMAFLHFLWPLKNNK